MLRMERGGSWIGSAGWRALESAGLAAWVEVRSIRLRTDLL